LATMTYVTYVIRYLLVNWLHGGLLYQSHPDDL
jgi:hypothetical protein